MHKAPSYFSFFFLLIHLSVITAQEITSGALNPAIENDCQQWIEGFIQPLNSTQHHHILNMLFVLRHHLGLEIARNYSSLATFWAAEVEYKMHYYQDTANEIASLKKYITGLEHLLPARQEFVSILQNMENAIDQLEDTPVYDAIDVLKHITQKHTEQCAVQNEAQFNDHITAYVDRVPAYLDEIHKWTTLYKALQDNELPLPHGDSFLQIQKIGTAHAFSRKILAAMDDSLINGLQMTSHLMHVTRTTLEIFDIFYMNLYNYMRNNNVSDEFFVALFDSPTLALEKNKSPLPLLNNFRQLYQTDIQTS